MDIQTSYLLSKLDELRAAQRDHGEMLRRIMTLAERKEAMPSPKLMPFTGLIARGAIMWAAGACVISYLARGGDPIKLLEALLKLFG